jgi:hypothetical protein
MMDFKRAQWLFPIAVTLHNGEEAIWMVKWVNRHPEWLGMVFLPDAAEIRVSLFVLTAAAFAVTYASWRKGAGSVWAYLLFGYVVSMLANVFIPHLSGALMFESYTPGVVTAVVINLPVMSYLAFRAVRERWVAGWKAVAFGVAVPLVLVGAIIGSFVLANTLRQ